MYRQARKVSDNSLVNLWLPTAQIPSLPPSFRFYNPTDRTCYYVTPNDAPSTTPGVVLTKWQGINSDLYFAEVCIGTSGVYALARGCDGSNLNLWKSLSGLHLPYFFSVSSKCGVIDSSSPLSATPGTLLTGEMVVSGCSDNTCITFTPTPTPTPYSYASGSQAEGDGHFIFVSPEQDITVGTSSNISFAFSADDLVVMHPIGASVSIVVTGSDRTITIPSTGLVFAPNVAGFQSSSFVNMTITDGTHSLTFATGTEDASTAAAGMTSAGFRMIVPNGNISTSLLTSLGMITSGVLKFKISIVPSGTGSISITSASLL